MLSRSSRGSNAVRLGHAVSRDLVLWEYGPVVLVATPGEPDKDGAFIGGHVLDGEVPVIVYTGVSPEAQCQGRMLLDGGTGVSYPDGDQAADGGGL